MSAFKPVTFQQTLPLKRVVNLEIEGNRDLHMHYKSPFKTQSLTFPLDIISPRPGVNKSINLAAGIAALSLFLMIGFCLVGYVQNPVRFGNPLLVVTCVFLPPALLALWFFNDSFTPDLVFFRADDGEELFKIRQQKQDATKPKAFADALAERIDSIRYPGNLSRADQLELYQKHLAFLFDEQVLSETEYQTILTRLEKQQQSGSIFKLV